MSAILAALAVAAGSVGCGETRGDPDAALPIDAVVDAMLPCTETGHIVGFGPNGAHPMADGDDLPVILGFQGFVFFEVGIRSPDALESYVTVRSNVRMADGTESADSHPGVSTSRVDGLWETDKVLVFFNDTPVADLYGREVDLALSVPTARCRLRATLHGKLVDGGVQLQDAGP